MIAGECGYVEQLGDFWMGKEDWNGEISEMLLDDEDCGGGGESVEWEIDMKRKKVEGLFIVMPIAPPNVFRLYDKQKEVLMDEKCGLGTHDIINEKAAKMSEFLYCWSLQCYDFLLKNELMIKDWAMDMNPWKLFGKEGTGPSPIVTMLMNVVMSHRLEGAYEHERAEQNWDWCRKALSTAFLYCGWGDLSSLLIATRVQTASAAMVHVSAHAAVMLHDMTVYDRDGVDVHNGKANIFDMASTVRLDDTGVSAVTCLCSVDDMHHAVSHAWSTIHRQSAREILMADLCRILPDMMKVAGDLVLLHRTLTNHMRLMGYNQWGVITCGVDTAIHRLAGPEAMPSISAINSLRVTMCTLACHDIITSLRELETTHRLLCAVRMSYNAPPTDVTLHDGHSRIVKFLDKSCDGLARHIRLRQGNLMDNATAHIPGTNDEEGGGNISPPHADRPKRKYAKRKRQQL
jgi:hypothetical protein